jgi:hypothetical protein
MKFIDMLVLKMFTGTLRYVRKYFLTSTPLEYLINGSMYKVLSIHLLLKY